MQAAPGEQNQITVRDSTVEDAGATLTPGPGCAAVVDFGPITCPGAARVEADAGDGNDSVRIEAFLPSDLHGGAGDDELSGGPLNDVLAGDSGRDFADGGEGDDRILLRDSKLDSALCGGGRDNVRAEVLDYLDYACETVDLGPPGRVGRLRPSRRPQRFVKIPGQNGEKIDRRILANVVQLIRRYKIRVVAGYALRGHKRRGEHPLGPGHRHRARPRRLVAEGGPPGQVGRAAAEPPAHALQVGGLQRRPQPRPRRPPPPLLAAPRSGASAARRRWSGPGRSAAARSASAASS